MIYKLKAILTFILLTFTFGTVDASSLNPDQVYVSIASKHINLVPDPGTKYNEINPGLILSWDNRKYGLNYWFGGIRNSFSAISPYAATAKMWKVTPNARFGIFGSIAGYYGNGSISTKIGNSGYVFLGGFQIEYKNLFFQIQPTLINNSNVGGVIVSGFCISLR